MLEIKFLKPSLTLLFPKKISNPKFKARVVSKVIFIPIDQYANPKNFPKNKISIF